MSDISIEVMAALILALFLFAITAVAATIKVGDLKAEAVKRGAAEWVVNPNNGEAKFEWKEVKP
jgi:hypothetical protein